MPGTVTSTWSRAGTKTAWVTPWWAIRSTIPPGSTSRWSTDGRPRYRATRPQKPPATWNCGITAMLTERSSNPSRSSMPTSEAKQAALVSITPLGSPVVPEE